MKYLIQEQTGHKSHKDREECLWIIAEQFSLHGSSSLKYYNHQNISHNKLITKLTDYKEVNSN